MTTTDVEVAHDAAVPSETFAARLEQARATERNLMVRVVRASIVAVPICIVIWVGIVSIALAIADSGNFEVALPMAAGVGIVAGVFFGMWWGFLRTADEFEELDRGLGRPTP
jgi:hypothetical protein